MKTRLDTVRTLQYAVAFVALMVFLFAVSALTTLLLAQLIPETRSIVTGSSFRSQVSYYLAALIVATPLWLYFSRLIQRRVERDPSELQAPERHLFLALVSAVGLIVSLFAVHTMLRVIFSLPVQHSAAQVLQDLVPALIRLIVYGAAAAVALRTARRENGLNTRAEDLALYVVSAFALAFLTIGALNAVTAIIGEITSGSAGLILGASASSLTLIGAQSAAWILSGGTLWAAITAFDRSTARYRSFRRAYLYVILAAAVAMTVISGTDLLYELLRRAFGYNAGGSWTFLKDTLPWLLVGATLWTYHWSLLRNLSDEGDTRSVVPSERRLAIAAYAFIGLAMAASGATVLLWLVLDFVFGTHQGSLLGQQWWVDRLSAGIAVLTVGLALWAPAWRLTQQAATDPDQRSSTERRWLLGGITLVAALAAIGFSIAFLWTLLQALLGGGLDATSTSNLFKYLGTALIALGIAGYYGTNLRRDIRLLPTQKRARIMALVEPGGEALADSLRRSEGRRLQVVGYLTQRVTGTRLGPEFLETRLATPETDRVLLVLGSDGALFFPCTENPQAEPQTQNTPNEALPTPGS